MLFLTLANHEQVKNISLASQKFQILAVGGKKSAKMKKWNKFSLFVRAPSTYLKHRAYFTSLITFLTTNHGFKTNRKDNFAT